MKKNHLHTRFIKYLAEKYSEELEEVRPEDPEDFFSDKMMDDIENKEKADEVEDDEVLDELLEEYRNLKLKYDSKIHNRKRK